MFEICVFSSSPDMTLLLQRQKSLIVPLRVRINNTWLSRTPSFWKTFVFKMSSVYAKPQTQRFQKLPDWRAFRKALFLWRISRHVWRNREKKKVAFSTFSSIVWTEPQVHIKTRIQIGHIVFYTAHLFSSVFCLILWLLSCILSEDDNPIWSIHSF